MFFFVLIRGKQFFNLESSRNFCNINTSLDFFFNCFDILIFHIMIINKVTTTKEKLKNIYNYHPYLRDWGPNCFWINSVFFYTLMKFFPTIKSFDMQNKHYTLCYPFSKINFPFLLSLIKEAPYLPLIIQIISFRFNFESTIFLKIG